MICLVSHAWCCWSTCSNDMACVLLSHDAGSPLYGWHVCCKSTGSVNTWKTMTMLQGTSIGNVLLQVCLQQQGGSRAGDEGR